MTALPLWADIAASVLIVAGALIALIGSYSLVHLPSFFERVHAPSVIATLGCWCVVLGSVLVFSFHAQQLAAYGMLIAVFLALAVPVVTLFLMRTGLFRARLAGEPVPAPLSRGGEGGASKAQRAQAQTHALALPAIQAALDNAEEP